jgi:hypothetical protein
VALVEEIEIRVQRLRVRNTPALRALRHEYSKRLELLPAKDVVKIASALIANRRVPRFIGDELITSRPDALATLDRAQLEQLGSTISSWDQVDCFACYLSGPAWREGYIEDHAIEEWARSAWSPGSRTVRPVSPVFTALSEDLDLPLIEVSPAERRVGMWPTLSGSPTIP